MEFEQRKKIALKVFYKLCTMSTSDIVLSNDTITINGAPLFFNDILDYYNRIKEVKK
tara:strand:- start:424 stop:594 length:171 start_codon:yes stop_codon:yes gene_type:complete